MTDSANRIPTIETDVPARLDRLPWSRFHWLVVCGLGVTWILDGLQVTLQGAIGAALKSKETLALTEHQIGLSATCYLAGAVLGALIFGYATDRFGRKKLFYTTLSVYLVAVTLTALAWNFPSYACFLALAGAGIGGEYAAINSAIDELIPARLRGTVDLIINSTYWAGAAAGSAVTIFFLNPAFLPSWLGWRMTFALGGILGIFVLAVRKWVPESPRWLLINGKVHVAEHIIADVEKQIEMQTGSLPPVTEPKIVIAVRSRPPWNEIARTFLVTNRSRTVLGLVLMASQAFFYNAIFFTYGLVLARFFNVPPYKIGEYIVPFALGNLLGPIMLGRLFDTIGRKTMIATTYILSGLLLAIDAWMFQHGMLTAEMQSTAWVIIFFIASSAASAAYLTVSELFPLELRGTAISLFYAIGTLIGGVAAPAYFTSLIATGSRDALAGGYYVGAVLMIIGGIAEIFFGVAAEGKSLESISPPLAEQRVVGA
ncbi:MAG TPA: MFS transporter [Candidatus Obscuribacterales bacterium]